MNYACEILNEPFQAVNLQRGAHNYEHVWLATKIRGMNCTDVVPKRVGFIVENNTGAEGTNANCPRRPCNTRLSCVAKNG